MEGLPILIFNVFMLVSVVEKVLKGQGGPDGQKRPPGPRPPGQRVPPGARRPPERRPPERRPLPRPPAAEAPGRADEMIPEDFWRELTGQPRRPRPAPAPAPPEELSWDDAAVAAIEAADDEETALSEERSLETYRREVVVHAPPRIVSLETPPLPAEQRHAAYHERLRRSDAALLVPAPAATLATSLRRRLREPAGARDALILSEVLGRPKGLE